MTLTREEAQESKEMETLRVHADALLSLSSPAASSSPDTSKTPPSSTSTPAARRALAAEGVFECKTCSKRFSSFQALGGHRTSHTRLQARMLLQQEPSAEHGAADRDRNRVHECAVCGLEFSMGQALGGHMRRHRGDTASAAAAPGSDNRLPDLNYPPVEDCGGGDGQEPSSAHRGPDHPLLDLLV
ncbi:zinc finger protein ZAT5-like [Lolium rigidum]|uniref:zinc finger protein ZAT5-like n=1 Tax=Lolium rigidum TaxID=89674 RepID=UPI001F5C8F60|nr:zinc finger protein ZAT5-like [Lolium rigidum]